MTKYFNWKDDIKKDELEECKNILEKDGIIVFPTETVYGIGANVFSTKAVEKIYKSKGRAGDNPLIVHIADKEELKYIVKDITKIEQKLINIFMPGPFTLILKRKEIIPNIVTANLDTVGIRMPENKIANELIKKAGFPLAAPSANISGKPSGTNIEDIKNELDGKVDAFIDGGMSDIGVESTVVKVINGIPTILRPGKITLEDIQKIIGNAKISENVFKEVKQNEKVESPGMKYKHYAPSTKCILICSEDEEKQILKVKEIAKKKSVCILGFNEHKARISNCNFIKLGSKENLEEISKNIFSALRKADRYGVELIVIEGVKKDGLGLAIMNRLVRTCEYNVIEV